jgi:hypothetical protein
MNLGKRLRLQPEQAAELPLILLLNGLDTTYKRTFTCEWMGMPESLCRHVLHGFAWDKLEWPRVRFLMKHAFRGKTLLRRVLGVAGLLPPRQIAFGLLTRQSFAGIQLARKLGLSTQAVKAMQCMDERWDGSGLPQGLRNSTIPVLSSICCVAQDLVAFGDIIGRKQAVDLVERRSGWWYDPGVVTAAITMHEACTLWSGIDHEDLVDEILTRNEQAAPMLCDDSALKHIHSTIATATSA